MKKKMENFSNVDAATAQPQNDSIDRSSRPAILTTYIQIDTAGDSKSYQNHIERG